MPPSFAIEGSMIVRQFLSWMDSAPPERRAEAAHALARAFLFSDVADEVRRDMASVMTLLLDDPSVDVRFALADALAAHEAAPRHIILALAADHAEIATLVLACSPLFIDGELIDHLRAGDVQRQTAIASRDDLSDTLAASIAEHGGFEACETLLERLEAPLAAAVLVRIAERFADHASILNRLFAREDLPAPLRQMLVRRLGDRLGAFVAGQGWLAERRADAAVREACERATIAIAADAGLDEMRALLDHLRVSRQLNATLILRAIAFGELAFVEAALALLARTAPAQVGRIVRGRRIGTLESLFDKAGLPSSMFDALRIALDVALNPACAEQRAETILTRMIARHRDTAEGVLALLRRFAAEQARDQARLITERYRAAA